MKYLLVLALTVLCCSAFGKSHYIAHHYLSEPQDYLSNGIALKVTHVTPSQRISNDGYVSFTGYTHDDGRSGGSIQLLVKSDVSRKLARRVGFALDKSGSGKVRTKLIRGTFVKLGARYAVVIGGTLEALLNENPPEFEIQQTASRTFNVASVGKVGAYETREDLIRLFSAFNKERRGANLANLTRDEFVARLRGGETFLVEANGRDYTFTKEESSRIQEEPAPSRTSDIFNYAGPNEPAQADPEVIEPEPSTEETKELDADTDIIVVELVYA
jgi:hypothetical protein